MIIVIADDISGAAELAGIGLRYGITVEMSTVVDKGSAAELLVIATDTRSINEEDAIAEMEKITSDILQLQPDFIFKKIDSVLRGHVVAELTAHLKILGYERALVVAANPSLGRTISDGTYFYNDLPIHKSSFSNDPEFPIKSSDVFKMLRVNNASVQVRKNGDELPVKGIIVGEVADNNDLKLWAKRIEKNILPAGASGFFSAILDMKYVKENKIEEEIEEQGQTALFVCGTTFNKSRDAIKKIKEREGPVSYMPEAILAFADNDDENYQLWSNEIVSFIHSKGKAIISVDPEGVKGIPVSAAMLRQKTAIVVDRIFKQENVHELFIEGGSTAAAIVRQLGLETFIPVNELAPGVVRMHVKERDMFITIKPGSYQWPGVVWDFE
jgi:uncharacterized protein YgbK (DUF1537 family)